MVICDDWTEYVKQILNFAGHGYEYYFSVQIPATKEEKIKRIDTKMIKEYPMVEWGKDRRYRAKKAGMANYAYIRWHLSGILLHTDGREGETSDPDTFFHLTARPYVVRIGSWVDIKIGKAKAGKRYTAYLTKESFRNIKALLREDIEHRRFDVLEKNYYRLEALPAFSGILAQMDDLYQFLRSDIKRMRVRNIQLRRLSLREVY